MAVLKMTHSLKLVLADLLAHRDQTRYGRQITESTGLPSGTLYPILARLEREELADGEWEDVAAMSEGRPRRRYYRLTEAGVRLAKSVR